jgi:signal transduction histidine kinase
MSWVYPSSEAAVTTRLGVESAFFAVSTGFLAGAVATILLGTPSAHGLWWALLPVTGLWLLLLAARRWRTLPIPVVVAMLVVAGVFVWLVVGADPACEATLVVVACIIATTALGSNLDRWTGAVGTLVGYAVAQGAVLLSAAPSFEIAPLIVAITVAVYYGLLAMLRHSSRAIGARLEFAALTDMANAERRSLELQSRALVHDTMLSELAAISLMAPGPLTSSARVSIGASLDSVRRAVAETPASGSAGIGAALDALVARLANSGVTVTVSGDPGVLDLLSEAARDALLLATHQALVNVASHSGSDRAELSLSESGTSVVVMIVDDGVGFDSSTVPEDRFGFRESIQGRVEAAGGTARILSSPGHGTSVILVFDVPEREL